MAENMRPMPSMATTPSASLAPPECQMPDADHRTTFSAGCLDRCRGERTLLPADRSAAGGGVRAEDDDFRALDPSAGDDYSQPGALADHVQRTRVEKLGNAAHGIAMVVGGICGVRLLNSRNNRHHVASFVRRASVGPCPLPQ